MIRFVFIIFCSTASAATIYKSEDEFGRPVFSNRADETASEVELKEPTTYKGGTPHSPRVLKKKTPAPQPRYTAVEIVTPENDTAVRDNSGTVTLTVNIEPPLHSQHILTLLMDGQENQELDGSGTAILANVDRGTHTFQLQVTHRKSGEVIETSPSSSITLLRHSVQH